MQLAGRVRQGKENMVLATAAFRPEVDLMECSTENDGLGRQQLKSLSLRCDQ